MVFETTTIFNLLYTIVLNDTWGGAIDLALLARECDVNLCVISFGREATSLQTFPARKSDASTAFLCYDGYHYDPVTIDGEPKVPPAALDAAQRAVQALAEQLTSKGRFTDLSQFSLRCLECRTPLDTKSAVEHAKATGHQSFAEFQE